MGDGSGDQDTGGTARENARPGRKQDRANPVGRALRSVYDDTLREDVPDDFMDLLRKLD